MSLGSSKNSRQEPHRATLVARQKKYFNNVVVAVRGIASSVHSCYSLAHESISSMHPACFVCSVFEPTGYVPRNV
jgi:hypothetical protein